MEKRRAIDLSAELMSISEAAVLTTIGPDGYPNTRAMLNLRNAKKYPALVSFFKNHADDFLVYFTTNTSSAKVAQVKENRKASVYFCKPDEWRGLMVCGDLELVSDPGVKRELWQPEWTMYYPGGPDDADYAIMALRPVFVKLYHQMETFSMEGGAAK